ncbi:MAG: cytochrome C oxidase subunit IV family protein [Cellulophaga sp.]
MKVTTNSSTGTWLFLLFLTLVSSAFSTSSWKYAVVVIMLLAVLKFIGVAFKFMELGKAHPFWKGCILVFLILFTTIILVLI